MFRELVRKKQQLSQEECISILKSELRGVLSVIGDDGYPYGIPIDHWYCEDNGKIYFHSGKTGHKIDAIKNCNKVSFCVYDKGRRNDSEWALNIRSVVIFGKITLIDDYDKAVDISRRLSYRFTSDSEYIEKEVERAGRRVLVLELTPENICGKLVNES